MWIRCICIQYFIQRWLRDKSHALLDVACGLSLCANDLGFVLWCCFYPMDWPFNYQQQTFNMCWSLRCQPPWRDVFQNTFLRNTVWRFLSSARLEQRPTNKCMIHPFLHTHTHTHTHTTGALKSALGSTHSHLSRATSRSRFLANKWSPSTL